VKHFYIKVVNNYVSQALDKSFNKSMSANLEKEQNFN